MHSASISAAVVVAKYIQKKGKRRVHRSEKREIMRTKRKQARDKSALHNALAANPTLILYINIYVSIALTVHELEIPPFPVPVIGHKVITLRAVRLYLPQHRPGDCRRSRKT